MSQDKIDFLSGTIAADLKRMRKNSISFTTKQITKGTQRHAKRGLYSFSTKDNSEGLSVARLSLKLNKMKIITEIDQNQFNRRSLP